MNEERIKIQRRLNKIEGQLKGIQKMIDNEACCSDILVQIAAVKAAVNKVGVIIFEKHAKDCLHKSAEAKSDEEIEQLMKVLTSFFR